MAGSQASSQANKRKRAGEESPVPSSPLSKKPNQKEKVTREERYIKFLDRVWGGKGWMPPPQFRKNSQESWLPNSKEMNYINSVTKMAIENDVPLDSLYQKNGAFFEAMSTIERPQPPKWSTSAAQMGYHILKGKSEHQAAQGDEVEESDLQMPNAGTRSPFPETSSDSTGRRPKLPDQNDTVFASTSSDSTATRLTLPDPNDTVFASTPSDSAARRCTLPDPNDTVFASTSPDSTARRRTLPGQNGIMDQRCTGYRNCQVASLQDMLTGLQYMETDYNNLQEDLQSQASNGPSQRGANISHPAINWTEGALEMTLLTTAPAPDGLSPQTDSERAFINALRIIRDLGPKQPRRHTGQALQASLDRLERDRQIMSDSKLANARRASEDLRRKKETAAAELAKKRQATTAVEAMDSCVLSKALGEQFNDPAEMDETMAAVHKQLTDAIRVLEALKESRARECEEAEANHNVLSNALLAREAIVERLEKEVQDLDQKMDALKGDMAYSTLYNDALGALYDRHHAHRDADGSNDESSLTSDNAQMWEIVPTNLAVSQESRNDQGRNGTSSQDEEQEGES